MTVVTRELALFIYAIPTRESSTPQMQTAIDFWYGKPPLTLEQVVTESKRGLRHTQSTIETSRKSLLAQQARNMYEAKKCKHQKAVSVSFIKAAMACEAQAVRLQVLKTHMELEAGRMDTYQSINQIAQVLRNVARALHDINPAAADGSSDISSVLRELEKQTQTMDMHQENMADVLDGGSDAEDDLRAESVYNRMQDSANLDLISQMDAPQRLPPSRGKGNPATLKETQNLCQLSPEEFLSKTRK